MGDKLGRSTPYPLWSQASFKVKHGSTPICLRQPGFFS